MGESSWIAKINVTRVGIIVVAALVSVIAGAFRLVYARPFSPLLVGGAIVAVGLVLLGLRRPVWALYATVAMVLVPEGLIPGLVNSILNRALTLLALVAWLLQVVSQRRRIRIAVPTLLTLGFITWCLLTLIWAPNLNLAATEVVKYAMRFIVYILLVANLITTRRTLHGLMITLALTGWLLILVSIGVVLVHGYQAGTRLAVLETNENQLGVSILVMATGVFWLASRERKPRFRRLLPAFAFLSLGLALEAMSGSRGGAISWAATLAACCLWRPTRRWAAMGLLLLLVAVIMAPSLFTITLDRFAVTTGDTALGGREAIWQAAWMLIKDSPWLGVGIGNSAFAVMPYLQVITNMWTRQFMPLHNPILVVWSETGIPGLVLYLSALGSAVWEFLRRRRQRMAEHGYYLASYYAIVFSIFVGFMLSWIKTGTAESSFTYFLMLGLLLIPGQLEAQGTADLIAGPDEVSQGDLAIGPASAAIEHQDPAG